MGMSVQRPTRFLAVILAAASILAVYAVDSYSKPPKGGKVQAPPSAASDPNRIIQDYAKAVKRYQVLVLALDLKGKGVDPTADIVSNPRISPHLKGELLNLDGDSRKLLGELAKKDRVGLITDLKASMVEIEGLNPKRDALRTPEQLEQLRQTELQLGKSAKSLQAELKRIKQGEGVDKGLERALQDLHQETGGPTQTEKELDELGDEMEREMDDMFKEGGFNAILDGAARLIPYLGSIGNAAESLAQGQGQAGSLMEGTSADDLGEIYNLLTEDGKNCSGCEDLPEVDGSSVPSPGEGLSSPGVPETPDIPVEVPEAPEGGFEPVT